MFADGDLALVDRQRRTAQSISDPNERMRWHGDADSHRHRARLQGAAGYRTSTRKSSAPGRATRSAQPMQPSPEVLSWVRSRIIAYAKAKERAA